MQALLSGDNENTRCANQAWPEGILERAGKVELYHQGKLQFSAQDYEQKILEHCGAGATILWRRWRVRDASWSHRAALRRYQGASLQSLCEPCLLLDIEELSIFAARPGATRITLAEIMECSEPMSNMEMLPLLFSFR